jgi:uncharacterized protein (TIGR03066 family)
MNTVRLALVGALVLGLTAAVRADDEKGGKSDLQKKLVGKWEVVKSTGKGGPPPGTTIEFTKDGKAILTAEEKGEKRTMEAAYKVEGKEVKLTVKQGDMERTETIKVVKVDDKELVVKHEKEEGEVTLKRKAP